MTFNIGNHTMKWGYEFIRPVFEFNLALTRSASFTGTRTGNADRRLHDRRLRQLDDRVRDCRSQSVHGEAPGVHRRLVEDASAADAELRPALRAVHPVRPEGRPAHDLGAGRAVHRRARRADRAFCSPAIRDCPARLTNSDLNNFAPRLGAAWDVTRRREDGRSRRLRHLLPADQRRDDARRRRAVARDDAAAAGTDRGSVRIARPDRAAAGIARPVRLLADLGVPRAALHAVSGADPHRLHRSGSEDELHPPLQRVAPAPARPQPRGRGRPTSARSARIWWATTTSTRRRSSTRRSPACRRRCRTSSSACRSAPASSARSRACSATSSDSTYHSMQLRVERRMARTFSFSASYALSKNLTNQPENTTGLISNIPNPFDLESLWGPSFLDRRHVVAASWVWSPQHTFANRVRRRLAERLDDDRLPPDPVRQPARVHDGDRRRAERHPAAERPVSRCSCPA